MGEVVDHAVGPILLREGNLLAVDKLKTTMRTKVHNSIGTESLLHPEVRSYIGIGRKGISTMHCLEVIIADSLTRLREKHHITKGHGRNGNTLFVAFSHGIVLPGSSSIFFGKCLSLVGSKDGIHPALEAIRRDELGVSLSNKVRKSTLCIAIEERALGHHHFLKLGFRRGQTRDLVPLVAQL